MGINVRKAFQSKYLSAADVEEQGKLKLTIADVVMEEVGRDKQQKPVVLFRGQKRGMVLNKTNGLRLVDMYGEDTDDWSGKQIVLVSEQVYFGAEQVQSIRVVAPEGTVPKKLDQELDDELPF